MAIYAISKKITDKKKGLMILKIRNVTWKMFSLPLCMWVILKKEIRKKKKKTEEINNIINAID